MRPDGACALVTGGTRGIGAAIVAALEADGWEVEVVARSEGTDITDPLAVERAFADIEERVGVSLQDLQNIASGELAWGIANRETGRAASILVVDTTGNDARRDEVIKKLDDIKDSSVRLMQAAGLEASWSGELSGHPPTWNGPDTCSLLGDNEVLGRDAERKDMVSWLTTASPPHRADPRAAAIPVFGPSRAAAQPVPAAVIAWR